VHTLDDVKRRLSRQEYQMRTFLAILIFAGSIALVAASIAGSFDTLQSPAAATPSTSATPDTTVVDV
jgi:hypothetical protein